jgi:hypothetical protein
MNIQCPTCNSLISIQPEKFPGLNELDCTFCGEKTNLKNGSGWIVNLQFVLTESDPDASENILPEKTGETFHHKGDLMLPSCSSHRPTALCEEQHEAVQQE